MAGFLKSVGGVFKAVAKAVVTPVSIPFALAGTVVIRGFIKPLVDLAATGAAYWIKNNFTGQSTLFGASTALTAFSNGLGSLSNGWNKFCFAGPKYLGSTLAETLEEGLNSSGWASTGTFDNDPDRDDLEDRAVKAGEKAFKEHTKKLKENKARLALTTGNFSFDKSKIKTEEWLEEGRRIQKEPANTPEAREAKNALIKEWFKKSGESTSLRSILHIIGVSGTAGKARDFFETSERKIARLESEIADKTARLGNESDSDSASLLSETQKLNDLKEKLERFKETPSNALDKMLRKTDKALNDALMRKEKPDQAVGNASAKLVKTKGKGSAVNGPSSAA